jgi:hypothetical protein
VWGLGSALLPRHGMAGDGSIASISWIRISSLSFQSEVVWILAPRCTLNCHSVELASRLEWPNSQIVGGKMALRNKGWRRAEYFERGDCRGRCSTLGSFLLST